MCHFKKKKENEGKVLSSEVRLFVFQCKTVCAISRKMRSPADGYVRATNVGEALTALNFFGPENQSKVMVGGAELVRPPLYKPQQSWYDRMVGTSDTKTTKTQAVEALAAPCDNCGAPWEDSDGWLTSGRHSRRCIFCRRPFCPDCKPIYMEPHNSNHAWVCKKRSCQRITNNSISVAKYWAQQDADPTAPRAPPLADKGANPSSFVVQGPRHTQEFCDL
uniref:Uncharacterized protein n=1 Tax=Aureoumbra lagunensis TaxID=44058 RepID=A0A7S3NGI6_9STRA